MESKFLWLLDNGHGKATPGKRSPKLPDGRQLLEYEFNRDIVNRLIIKLNQAGISSHDVVPEVDGDVALGTRTQRANSLVSTKPKLYISVHANALDDNWSDANGIETFHYTGSAKSERLAKFFQSNLILTVGWRDRGVKYAGFYVLRYTQMPAILTENGFYSNKAECEKLLSEEWRERIAQAHFLAIEEVESGGVNF